MPERIRIIHVDEVINEKFDGIIYMMVINDIKRKIVKNKQFNQEREMMNRKRTIHNKKAPGIESSNSGRAFF